MVTDKDREAAENHASAYGMYRVHFKDTDPLPMAFAAHREAAIAERDAQLVNWLRERVNTPAPSNDGLTARAAISLIADAIEMKEPWSLNQYYEGE